MLIFIHSFTRSLIHSSTGVLAHCIIRLCIIATV